MNASIAPALPGSERSMQVGPPLYSTPSDPIRKCPVPESGPAVDHGGGPSTFLARCVGDADEFAAEYWGRRPLLRTHCGDAHAFDDVFSLQALDELVAHGARIPAVRMIADGAPLPPARFCSATRLGGRNLDDVVDPAKVVARMAEGATLVMQSLHRTSSSVGAFVARLQDELSHPVQANAYLTPPNAVGLAEHSDLHDVLAVQLHGSKRWWVDGLGDVVMRPGDVMYVPRGVRHRAETATETSLHLTLGVIRVTARQVIDRILNAAPDLLDDPLPVGYRHRDRRDELERHLDAALDDALALIGAADPRSVACDEQSRWLAGPPVAGRICSNVLIDRIDADAVIRWIAPAPLVATGDDNAGRPGHWVALHSHGHRTAQPATTTIRMGDRTLTVPSTALDALRTLSSRRPIRVGDLPGLDAPSRIVVARRLVRESVCIVDAFG